MKNLVRLAVFTMASMLSNSMYACSEDLESPPGRGEEAQGPPPRDTPTPLPPPPPSWQGEVGPRGVSP